MKFIAKIDEGADLFERFNEDLKQHLDDMCNSFPTITPSGFAGCLRAFNEKFEAFASCVRAGYIVEHNVVPMSDNDN